MKTIGLLTIQRSVNSGASLQAASLYRTLKALGHDPCVIDYCPQQFMSYMDKSNIAQRRTPRGLLKTALIGKNIEKTRAQFEEYGNKYYPNQTKRFDNFSQLKDDLPRFDIYVCGSDQIWNPPHVKYDDTWMFGFVPKESSSVKFISYAASIGEDKLNSRDLQWLKNGLKRFDWIGVREDTGVELVQSLGYMATQCLDPVFLTDAPKWRKQETPPDITFPEKYIFYYPLDPNPLEDKLLLEMKRRFGLKIVSMSDKLIKPRHADITVSGYSPSIFLWLLDHAEIVLTNSFHGLAFSIIFEKPLVSFKNLTRNSRLESLLRLICLEGYQVNSIEELRRRDPYEDSERFCQAHRYIDIERTESIGFLERALAD